MTTNGIILSGVCFEPDDFNNYGWVDVITVNGLSYIRILGLFAAAMADLGRGMVGAATSTHNLSTMSVGNSVTVTLASNVPYAAGSHVQVANDSTHYFQVLVTAAVTGTSMAGTVEKVVGTGSLSTWQTSVTGAIGATGAGAYAAGGVKTAAFSWVANTEYIVDLAAAAADVTGTLSGSFSAQDSVRVTVIADGTHTLTMDPGAQKIGGSVQTGTITNSGVLTLDYKNSTYGFAPGWAPSFST